MLRRALGLAHGCRASSLASLESGSIRVQVCRSASTSGPDRGGAPRRVLPGRAVCIALARPRLPRSQDSPVPIAPFRSSNQWSPAPATLSRFLPLGIAVNGRLLPNTAPLRRDAANRPLIAGRAGSIESVRGLFGLHRRTAAAATTRGTSVRLKRSRSEGGSGRYGFALISTLAAGLVGAFCWRTWWSIGFAFAVPILVGFKRESVGARSPVSLLRGGILAIGPRLRSFAGTTMISGALTWMFAVALLAAPLTLAWTQNRTAAAWRIPMALGHRRSTADRPHRLGVSRRLRRRPFPRNGLAWPRRRDGRAGARPLGKPRIWIAIAVASRSLLLLLTAGSTASSVGGSPNESRPRTPVRGTQTS